MSEEKMVYTPCQGGACHEACVLTTYVRDSQVLRTEKTVDPKTGEELTGICQKGIECARLPYIENRVKYPLKRVGKRGEGKFERITWDQAMDEIGAKLNEIKDKYGRESILLYNYPCGVSNQMGSMNIWLSQRFVNTFGATLMPWPPVDQESCHAAQVAFGSIFGFMGFDLRLARKAKLILIWGGNPIGFTRAAHTSGYLLDAQENGTKIIDVGTVYDSTAARADQFIPINPGTDGALALAMCNVMLKDNIWDQEFMIKHTVAPFLVRDDNGKFLRESDIVEGGSNDYVYWNKVPVGPRTIAAHQTIPENASPDLFAETVVNGIPCKTAMLHLKNLIEPWTPEFQEKITGVPANTVKKLTHEIVETDPTIIYEYMGMRYFNAGYTGRLMLIVAALSGVMTNELGGLAMAGASGEDYPINVNRMEIFFPDGDPQKVIGKAALSLTSMIKAGFPYKALLNVLGNPLQNWPNRDLWENRIYPKLDLIVVHEYRLSDTAKFADYVLPDTTPLERTDVVFKMGRAILCEPAIEPLGEARTVADFYRELSKRIGIGEYFDKSLEEWLEIFIKADDPAVTSLDPPLTMERLQKEKMVKLNVPEAEHDVWGNMDFLTDSGKIELYSEHLADVGAAIPKYVEPIIRGPERKRFPLQLLVYRGRFFMQTQFSDLPDLVYLAGPQPELRMNPVDAEARGIASGDFVEVFNDRGSFKCRVRFTQHIAPGTTHVLFSYPAHMWDGDPPQALMNPLGVPEFSDPVIEKWGKLMGERSPFPTVDWDTGVGQGWENLWDNLCDVRKA
jgi:molybdopterin-containing oxidoreductase family molybdopterin binding subunit